MTKCTNIFDFIDKPCDFLSRSQPAGDLDELCALCADPLEAPVKLINEDNTFCSELTENELFLENSGFLVVGVIGLQGAGKSSVLNLLANELGPTTSVFDGPFPTQSEMNLLSGSPETRGIDLYITQDRVFLLDLQAVFSTLLVESHLRRQLKTGSLHSNEVGRSVPGSDESISLDSFSEIVALQQAAFLLNVCHVVVTVQDNLNDTRIIRLLDQAFALRPILLAPLLVSGLPNTDLLEFIKTNTNSLSKPSKSRLVGSDDTNAVEVTENASLNLVSFLEQKRKEIIGITGDTCNLMGIQNYTASLVFVFNRSPSQVFSRLPRNHHPLVAKWMRSVSLASTGSDSPLQLNEGILGQNSSCFWPERKRTALLFQLGQMMLAEHWRNQARNNQCIAPTTPSSRPLEETQTGVQDFNLEQNNKIDKELSKQSEEGVSADCYAALEECEEKLAQMLIWRPEPSFASGAFPTMSSNDPTRPLPELGGISNVDNSGNITVDDTDTLMSGAVPNAEEVRVSVDQFNRVVQAARNQLKTAGTPQESAKARCFILPELDENGQSPVGCPTYAQCAYQLQEAIFSTTRQHMTLHMNEKQWFSYAKQMWTMVTESNIFSDYYAILQKRIL